MYFKLVKKPNSLVPLIELGSRWNESSEGQLSLDYLFQAHFLKYE